MKLLWGKWGKVTKPDFRKKISFWLFWHFHSQNSQKSRFLPLWEKNATLYFADFAYLDRSHRYLQLFYWHQVLEKSSWPSRGHFRPKNQKIRFRLGVKNRKFSKKNFFSFFSIFFVWSWKLQKKIFFPLWGQVTWDLEFFQKKSKIEIFRILSHFYRVWVIGSVRYRKKCKYKMGRSICKRPQVQLFF